MPMSARRASSWTPAQFGSAGAAVLRVSNRAQSSTTRVPGRHELSGHMCESSTCLVGSHCLAVYTDGDGVYTGPMAKHLIDLDEEALRAARTELGTGTIRETVNEALRRATSRRDRAVSKAIDTLAMAQLSDRAEAWR